MEVLKETERLLIRPFSSEDIEAAKKFWGDPEVMARSGGAAPHEDLPKVLESYRKCQEEKGLSVYAVAEKTSERVIGAAGYNIRDSVELIELIYHFSKADWGKGYATEAAKACLELAEQHGRVETVYASADPRNRSSARILEKIGFEYKGMKWFDDTNQDEPYYEYGIQKISS